MAKIQFSTDNTLSAVYWEETAKASGKFTQSQFSTGSVDFTFNTETSSVTVNSVNSLGTPYVYPGMDYYDDVFTTPIRFIQSNDNKYGIRWWESRASHGHNYYLAICNGIQSPITYTDYQSNAKLSSVLVDYAIKKIREE